MVPKFKEDKEGNVVVVEKQDDDKKVDEKDTWVVDYTDGGEGGGDKGPGDDVPTGIDEGKGFYIVYSKSGKVLTNDANRPSAFLQTKKDGEADKFQLWKLDGKKKTIVNEGTGKALTIQFTRVFMQVNKGSKLQQLVFTKQR
jgi:hypothetical protein